METPPKLLNYWPLIALVLGTALAAYALRDILPWMHGFMGLFLLVFSLLKIFNPSKFADGFAMYDLLAKRFRPYGLVYPFLEFALALAYLSGWNPELTYLATITLFGFGLVGVLLALRKGLHTTCACMGNVLQVPLSTVTLTENIAMVAMAGSMLLF
jgi:hypothetical protein